MSDPRPVDPATLLGVSLEAQQWNAVISVLSEAPVPYRVVAPLIQSIGQQIQAAAAQAAERRNLA